MGTAVVGLGLLVLVGAVIRTMVRDKKSGKSLQCGGCCRECNAHGNGHCAHREQTGE
ncbi:MAG: FeoB-associated Cys-rich membrane protein [Lachnospiraceae bacterium]|nr:FeoB-associated Cys-rich membrane protein [Lachnospiraceae bacterium]